MNIKKKIMVGVGLVAAVAGGVYWWKNRDRVGIDDYVTVTSGVHIGYEGKVSNISESGTVTIIVVKPESAVKGTIYVPMKNLQKRED